jgi:hypothetical protein
MQFAKAHDVHPGEVRDDGVQDIFECRANHRPSRRRANPLFSFPTQSLHAEAVSIGAVVSVPSSVSRFPS